MTFRGSITTCLGPKYFFKFQGRASRSEYWWFALFVILVNIGSSIFWLFPQTVAASLSFLLGLALMPATLGVTVRRLHDRNLGGWWLLAPLGLLVYMRFAGRQAFTPVADVLSFGLCLTFLVILCMPSQPLPNRYGPSPLAEHIAQNRLES